MWPYIIGFSVGVIFTIIAEVAFIYYLIHNPSEYWDWRGNNSNNKES